ncbi:hypothetical protein J2S16_000533 [Cytobacillus kochii]|nr:hypothetical protein [Cytobacillus kochii]
MYRAILYIFFFVVIITAVFMTTMKDSFYSLLFI